LMAEILHQLIGSLSHYLQGFIHSKWCRISAINSISFHLVKQFHILHRSFRKNGRPVMMIGIFDSKRLDALWEFEMYLPSLKLT